MPEYVTSIVGVPLTPLLLGALAAVVGPWIAGWLGGARTRAAFARAVSLGLVLAALMLLSAGQEVLGLDGERPMSSLGLWLGLKPTTSLSHNLLLEPVGFLFAAVALVWGTIVSFEFVAGGAGAGREQVASVSLAVGGLVLAALGNSALTLAVGWQLAGVGATLGCARSSRWARLIVADGALWIGLVAVLMGAGTLSWMMITRACALGAGSRFTIASFATGYPGGGISIGAVAAWGLVLAALIRGLLRPRGTAGGAMVLLAVLLLVRCNAVLGLVPSARVCLIVIGGSSAVYAALCALREDGPVAGAGASMFAGLAFVAVGAGGWAAAILLAIAGMIGESTLDSLARSGAARSSGPQGWAGAFVRWATAGAVPGVALFGAAGALQACVLHIVPLGPLVGGLGALCVLVSLVAMAMALGRARKTMAASEDTTLLWLAVTLAVFGIMAGGLAIPGLVGPVPAIDVWLAPWVQVSAGHSGIYASGPQAWVTKNPATARTVALVIVIGSWALAIAGAALGRRWQPRRALDVKLSWSRVASALGDIGRRLSAPLGPPVAKLLVSIGARIDGLHRLTLAHGALALVLGTAVVLAHVYLNPRVATLGPSRAYPVDMGGLSPKIVRPRSLEERATRAQARGREERSP